MASERTQGDSGDRGAGDRGAGEGGAGEGGAGDGGAGEGGAGDGGAGDGGEGAGRDSEPVPKLPRGRGMRFSAPELFRIAMTLGFLVAVIALTKPCASAVSTFVMGFDGSGSGKGSGSAGSGSAVVDPYEHLTPNMSDDEVKAAIERAKAKNAAHETQTEGVEGVERRGSAGAPRTPPVAPGSAVTPRTPPVAPGVAPRTPPVAPGVAPRTPPVAPGSAGGSAAPKPVESHLVLPDP